MYIRDDIVSLPILASISPSTWRSTRAIMRYLKLSRICVYYFPLRKGASAENRGAERRTPRTALEFTSILDSLTILIHAKLSIYRLHRRSYLGIHSAAIAAIAAIAADATYLFTAALHRSQELILKQMLTSSTKRLVVQLDAHTTHRTALRLAPKDSLKERMTDAADRQPGAHSS